MNKLLISLLISLFLITVTLTIVTKCEIAELQKQVAEYRNIVHQLDEQMEFYEEKVDNLTHPATIAQRSIDWILRQGEFAE